MAHDNDIVISITIVRRARKVRENVGVSLYKLTGPMKTSPNLPWEPKFTLIYNVTVEIYRRLQRTVTGSHLDTANTPLVVMEVNIAIKKLKVNETIIISHSSNNTKHGNSLFSGEVM